MILTSLTSSGGDAGSDALQGRSPKRLDRWLSSETWMAEDTATIQRTIEAFDNNLSRSDQPTQTGRYHSFLATRDYERVS